MCVLQQVFTIPEDFLSTDAPTRESYHARRFLRAKAFTREGFYARRFLRAKVFTHESYSLEKLLRAKVIPSESYSLESYYVQGIPHPLHSCQWAPMDISPK